MVSRILVMNDDQNILEQFRLILEPEGYEVYLTFLRFEHIREFEQLSPSLIILDLKFGEQAQGMLMVQQIRIYAPSMRTPMIICTAALHEILEQEETFSDKGILILYKPFDIDELLHVVHQLLPLPNSKSLWQAIRATSFFEHITLLFTILC